MKLTIDTREFHLHSSLEKQGVSFEIVPMDLGDIEITGDIGQRFLFERKTLDDLAASLRDGRFKDQKDRLLGVLQREPKTSIAYIIEGRLSYDLSELPGSHISRSALISLLNTLQLRYRIPVIVTDGISETTALIQRILRRLDTEPDFCPVSDGSNSGCFENTSLLPKISQNRKTDNESIIIAMLTAIPGVSHATSTGIQKWFAVDKGGLFTFIRSHTLQEFETEISQIKISGRGISKKIREMLFSVFYSNTPIKESETVAETKKSNPRKIGERININVPLFVDD